MFNIVTKTIANRLKIHLPYIVGPYQSKFVLGRLITDNALIAFEIFHFMRKIKIVNTCLAGLKLDMVKAYNRVQ